MANGYSYQFSLDVGIAFLVGSEGSEQVDDGSIESICYMFALIFFKTMYNKNNGKPLNRQSKKVVAVAYRRWSFTRDSNCKASTANVLVCLILGRLQEVVAYGGLTVLYM